MNLIVWTPAKVQNADDKPRAYAEYLQQTMGVPWPTAKDLVILRRKIKEVFENYPQADYYTLCRLAAWCKSRRKRYSRVWMVVETLRDAWAAGALPELDPEGEDKELEEKIAEALKTEEREGWRRRLMGASGRTARKEAYEEWQQSNSQLSL